MNPSHNLSTAVEKANYILSVANIQAQVVSFHQLRFVAPVIFIKIFQNIYHIDLDNLKSEPINKEDHLWNVNIFLAALKSKTKSSLIHYLNSKDIVSGDHNAIECLVNYFYQVVVQMSNQQHVINEKESITHQTNISVIKQSHIYLAANVLIDQDINSTSTTVVDSQIVSNLYLPSHPILDNGSGSDEASHENLKKIKEEDADDRSTRTKSSKKKKSKKKRPQSASSPTKSVNLSTKSTSSRNPARPTTPSYRGHWSRTYPPHHDRSGSRYITTPTSPTHLGDIPCYDTYTGHRITKEEVESQRIDRKDKYLSLGAVLTETGELRDKETFEPIPISQIQAAREREKQLQYDNAEYHSKTQFTLTDSRYPGRNTEKSVKKYVKKMKSLRNSIDELIIVEPDLYSRTRIFKSYRYLSIHDLVISIEYCHHCEENHSNYGHCSKEYSQYSDEILKFLSQFIHSLNPSIRLGVVRYPAKISSPSSSSSSSHNSVEYSRIGALEVQIGYKMKNNEICAELIYSKLNTHQWPSKTVLLKRLQRLLSLYQITNTIKDENIPGILWENIPISSSSWEYIPPDPDIRKEKGPFLWLFDYRSLKYQYKYQIGTNIKVLHCLNPWNGQESYSCIGIIRRIIHDPPPPLPDATTSTPTPPPTSSLTTTTTTTTSTGAYVSPSSSSNHKIRLLVYISQFNQQYLVDENQCFDLNKPDPYAPPTTFETLNSIPVILSILIQYAYDNHLLTWSLLSSEEDTTCDTLTTSGTMTTHLLLSKQSFLYNIGKIAWKCIKYSPGKKRGTMRYQSMDLSVQLAYSPPVIDYIHSTISHHKPINIMKLMQIIRPNITDDEVISLYQLDPPILDPILLPDEHEEHDPNRHHESTSKKLDSLSYSQNDTTFTSPIRSNHGQYSPFQQLNMSNISQESASSVRSVIDENVPFQGGEDHIIYQDTSTINHQHIVNSDEQNPKVLEHSVSFNFPILKTLFSDDCSERTSS